MGHRIYVDDEVFQRLQEAAEPFVDTPNSVLRKLLDLPPATDEATPSPAGMTSTRRRQGALFPLIETGVLKPGQPLHWRRRNQRQEHVATVLDNGELQLADGRRYRTPSAAAVSITGYQINGWNVWETQDGTPLGDLR